MLLQQKIGLMPQLADEQKLGLGKGERFPCLEQVWYPLGKLNAPHIANTKRTRRRRFNRWGKKQVVDSRPHYA